MDKYILQLAEVASTLRLMWREESNERGPAVVVSGHQKPLPSHQQGTNAKRSVQDKQGR